MYKIIDLQKQHRPGQDPIAVIIMKFSPKFENASGLLQRDNIWCYKRK
jgi:hypothetical protein